MLLVGGLKLAASAAGLGKGDAGGQGQGPGGGGRGGRGAVAVSQTTAVQRPFLDTIEVLGVAKGRQSVTVTSNTTELITGVHFTDGAFVREGQVLVDLKAQEETAGIAQAQAALNLAKLDYQRWKALGDKGVAAPAAIDLRRAALLQAEASLAAAQSRRGDRTIRAPFSGVVGLSDVAPGTLINPGAAIVGLDDVSVIRVDVDVPDRYLSALRTGMPISARSDAYPDERVQGRIATVDTRVDQRTRSVKARAEFPNPSGRLRPGMLMHVSLDRGSRVATAVPEAAVQFEGEQAFVYVIAHKGAGLVALRHEVKTGVDDGTFVEVLEGLAPGQTIVADGVNRVSPNQPVRLAGAESRGAGGPGAGGGAGGRPGR